jgi:predicted transposase YbfD/YdcC
MSVSVSPLDFNCHFELVNDPRINRSKMHRLIDIMFIAVAGTIAGCEGPTDIADFAGTQLAWCRKFVPLANGVPSHDTISRVLSLIKPTEFQQAFLDWIAVLPVDSNEEEQDDADQPKFVPIDGKTLRGSKGARDRSKPLHIVSAWASAQGVTLGQVAVDQKSNEITAIPKLLEMLELTGAIITIDAMGCQKEIAAKIVSGGGDYVLAVKDNQPTLHQAILDYFAERHELQDFADMGCRQHTTTERSRGRDETRYYAVAPLPASLSHLCRDWKGLKSLGQVINTTVHEGKETYEVRYYILSRKPRVHEFADAVRSHWGIESMHWVLDVVFGEDLSRIRNGDGPENFGFLRKFVIGMLKRDTSEGSLKRKRKRAAWSTDFLETLLFG